jgi:hypothetical protein
MGEAKQKGTYQERIDRALAIEDEKLINRLKEFYNSDKAKDKNKKEAKRLIEALGGEV